MIEDNKTDGRDEEEDDFNQKDEFKSNQS